MAEKLLIVDDEPGLVKMGKMVFELEGYQIETAASGEEAAAMILAEQPPFKRILTDCWDTRDGQQDKYGIFRRVVHALIERAEREPEVLKTRVVAVSANHDLSEGTLAREVPASAGLNLGILKKPFDVDNAIDTVAADNPPAQSSANTMATSAR